MTPLLVTKHERCVCKHCRCEHQSGFMACTACPCIRYTWPGKGADLHDNHRLTKKKRGTKP